MMTYKEEIEFAVRELATSIDHVINTFDKYPDAYGRLPHRFHQAFALMMIEIQRIPWERIGDD